MAEESVNFLLAICFKDKIAKSQNPRQLLILFQFYNFLQIVEYLDSNDACEC